MKAGAAPIIMLPSLLACSKGVVEAEYKDHQIHVYGTAPWQEIVNFAIRLKQSNRGQYVKVDAGRCPYALL